MCEYELIPRSPSLKSGGPIEAFRLEFDSRRTRPSPSLKSGGPIEALLFLFF